VKSAITLP
jgi:hypothetical protein